MLLQCCSTPANRSKASLRTWKAIRLWRTCKASTPRHWTFRRKLPPMPRNWHARFGLVAEPLISSTMATASEAIVEAAEELDVDVIILGSRGLRGFKATLLGSTSANVLHHATRPTLVIPSDAVALARRNNRRTADAEQSRPNSMQNKLTGRSRNRDRLSVRCQRRRLLHRYFTQVFATICRRPRGGT